MNDEKLLKVLKQLTTFSNLQSQKNKSIDFKINLLKELCENLDTRLKIIEHENLTKSARIT